jgi:hypothetical protein
MIKGKGKYMTTPLIETTDVVWELKVFDPVGAKVFHDDQGPLRLVAVEYMLSFGAVLSQLKLVKLRICLEELTPASKLACKHEVYVPTLVDCW